MLSSNPIENPDPTKNVKWGLYSGDEMAFTGGYFTYDDNQNILDIEEQQVRARPIFDQLLYAMAPTQVLVLVFLTPGQDWISDKRRSSCSVFSVRTLSRCEPTPVRA